MEQTHGHYSTSAQIHHNYMPHYDELQNLFSETQQVYFDQSAKVTTIETYHTRLLKKLNNLPLKDSEFNKRISYVFARNLPFIQFLIFHHLTFLEPEIFEKNNTETIKSHTKSLTTEQTMFMFYLVQEEKKKRSIVFYQPDLLELFNSLDPHFKEIIKQHLIPQNTYPKELSNFVLQKEFFLSKIPNLVIRWAKKLILPY